MKNTFKLGMNTTHLLQVCHNPRDSVDINPKAVVNTTDLIDGAFLEPVKNFIQTMISMQEETFYFERTYSLGDLLMLLPALRYVEEMGFSPYLRTTWKYCNLMTAMGVSVQAVEQQKKPEHYGLLLNDTVDRDHTVKELQTMHRVFIYLAAIGVTEMPRELNWHCNLSDFPKVSFDEQPYIVFQGRGTTAYRGLPDATVEFILNKLTEQRIKVVYIGEQIDGMMINSNMVKLQFMHSTLEELFSWVAGAACIVTMDSSPLWVSHFTRTPVVAVLGPSRPEERLSLHPLYPEGAVAVRLNEEINCASCFEVARECNHKYTCLKADKEVVWQKIEPSITKYWESKI